MGSLGFGFSGYFPFTRNRRKRRTDSQALENLAISKVIRDGNWWEEELIPKTDGFGKSYTLHGYPKLLYSNNLRESPFPKHHFALAMLKVWTLVIPCI